MRGTLSRLQRLEIKKGRGGERRFYIFGRDEDELAERGALALLAGTIKREDEARSIHWRRETPAPSARWLTAEEMTNDELSDAIHAAALTCGREPLPDDATSDEMQTELAAIRSELRAETGLPSAFDM